MVPAKKATLTRPSGRTGVTGRADSRIVPDPKLRRWYAAAFRSVRNRPMMHGLIEVDVTEARALLGEHRVRTGESLSFTAFLIACLARSVEENKAVHALRKGRRHLVLFDSVDVYTLVERTVAGQQQPMPYVVREANRKSVRDVHQEIRAAQVQDAETSLRWLRSLPDILFTPILWVFTRLGRRHPQLS